jgi:hypothetical protein
MERRFAFSLQNEAVKAIVRTTAIATAWERSSISLCSGSFPPL